MNASLLQKLPIIIAGVLLIAALVIIYYRSKNVTKSEFFKILKNTRYIKAWILIFVLVLTVFFGIFNHIKEKQEIGALVALNYSEASLAQNSNGTRYNMSEIICDEVVAKAIEMGAFEDVTVKQLKDCLSVYPYLHGDVNDESNYLISTEFLVEYNASKHTDHLDAENVVTLITIAYKEYYIEKYTDNFSLSNQVNKPDYSEMEYMDVVAYFNKETTTLLNYLYGMAEKGSSFVTSNNATFNSIAGKVYQFKKNQIEDNLKSLILQYGIVRDESNYVDRLAYQNTTTGFDMQKNVASFNLCNLAIDMYAEEMTRVVLVPTWDGSGKYYMGRTKVGVDELSVMATAFSDNVASNNKTIMDNQLIIDKIQNTPKNTLVKAEVEALIASIDKSIDNFTTEALLASKEYSSYKMNQCIAVSIHGTSLMSELKTVIIFAFFAYLCALLYSISKKFPKA